MNQVPTIGRYRLVVHIGGGGMADVFLGVVTGTIGFSKLQVIKVIKPGMEADPEQVGMFINEARLAARLNHPHVVQTNDAGVGEDGRLFLAMEHIEGQSLLRFIGAHKKNQSAPLPLPIYLRILLGALAGLHYAHELSDYNGAPLSIVHRDVSPHNVMVTYDGVAKLVDFGIAKAATNKHTTSSEGIFKGKIGYAAPEQFLGWPIDRRTDVYAIGVMLWEAITGLSMWRGVDDMTVLRRVMNNDIPRLPEQIGSAHPELSRIVERALAYNPNERYPTALAMRTDLEAFVESRYGQVKDRDVGDLLVGLFQNERAMVRARIDELINHLEAGAPPPASLPSVAVATFADGQSSPSHARSQGAGSYSGAQIPMRAPNTTTGVSTLSAQPYSSSSSQTKWRIAAGALVAVLGVTIALLVGELTGSSKPTSAGQPSESAPPPQASLPEPAPSASASASPEPSATASEAPSASATVSASASQPAPAPITTQTSAPSRPSASVTAGEPAPKPPKYVPPATLD